MANTGAGPDSTLAEAQPKKLRIELPERGAIERVYRMRRRKAVTYWCRDRVLVRTPDEDGRIHEHVVPYGAIATFGFRRTRFSRATLITAGLVVVWFFMDFKKRMDGHPQSHDSWPDLWMLAMPFLAFFLAVPEERIRFMTVQGTWELAAFGLQGAELIEEIQRRVMAARPSVRPHVVDWKRLPLVSTVPASRVQPILPEGAEVQDLSEVAIGLPPGPFEGLSLWRVYVISIAIGFVAGILSLLYLQEKHVLPKNAPFALSFVTGIPAAVGTFYGIAALWRRGRKLFRTARAKLGFG